jgi:hypothetical protein
LNISKRRSERALAGGEFAEREQARVELSRLGM